MHRSVDFVGKVVDGIHDCFDENNCYAHRMVLNFLPIDYYNSFRTYYVLGHYYY